MNNLGTVFKYKYKDSIHQIITTLIGKYNVYNLLVALIILRDLGVKENIIDELLPSASSSRKDADDKNMKLIVLLLIMRIHLMQLKVVTTMQEITSGDIYVVFGCTGDRDRTKRPIMTDIVTSMVKYAILTNDDPHNEDPTQIISDMIASLKK